MVSDDRVLIEQFVRARTEARSHTPPSEQGRRLELAEAYRLQDQLREALLARGERLAGWKAAFTTRAAQEANQLAEPGCAFLLASGVLASPAEVAFAAWVANHLGARGLGLRAGDIVMTGSVSKPLRPKAGETVRATYTRLGSTSVRVS